MMVLKFIGKASKPIVIHSPTEGQPRFVNKEDEPEPSKLEIYRVAHVYVFNQSDVPQTLTILESKIRGPGCKHFLSFSSMTPMTIPPHEGGNVPIYFFNDEWLNLSKESLDALVMEWHPFRCLLQIHAQTLSGRKIKFCGWTKLLKPHYSP